MKTSDFKIAVVAPLHKIPTQEWVSSLLIATQDISVIIVDDSPEQNLKSIYSTWTVYDREDQKKELGDAYESFKVFHKSSACRNFGNFIAWKLEYDIIIGLDSDCNVPNDFIEKHVEALQTMGYGWTNPIKHKGWFPRGYPYSERNRKIVANLGLWNHVLDINAKDRGEGEPIYPLDREKYDTVPMVAESFIPFSGMNWAMWREAMPGYLFLPNFDFTHKDKTYEFRRHDDIWGGYIFQKLMEKRNERMTYGLPIVYHDTVIDKEADMKEEDAMIEFENTFYGAVDQAMDKVTVSSYEDMMWQFADIISKDWVKTEWEPLIKPLMFWADLFQ